MNQKQKKSGFDSLRLQTFINVFEDILGTIREPLVVLDSDLKVVKANHSFYRTFNVGPGDTEGILIYDLGNRQWNIPKLRELLEDILLKNTLFNDFEVELNFESIGHKIMSLNARRTCRKSSKTQLILLAIEDVTEREYYKRHLEKNGSSLAPLIKTTLKGWQKYKSHPDKRIRKRVGMKMTVLRTSYAGAI